MLEKGIFSVIFCMKCIYTRCGGFREFWGDKPRKAIQRKKKGGKKTKNWKKRKNGKKKRSGRNNPEEKGEKRKEERKITRGIQAFRKRR